MSFTSSPGDAAPGTTPVDEARALVRRNLSIAGAGFVLLMVFTFLALFTPAFDGELGGLGVGYVAGFVDFVAVMVLAALHCRRANRRDDELAR